MNHYSEERYYLTGKARVRYEASSNALPLRETRKSSDVYRTSFPTEKAARAAVVVISEIMRED